MFRILFGVILFALILALGVVVTVKPGTDAAYQAAETRIAQAIEDNQRRLIETLERIDGRMEALVRLGRLECEGGAGGQALAELARLKSAVAAYIHNPVGG